MKFYIIGSKTDNVNCKVKNALYTSDDIDDAVENFYKIINRLEKDFRSYYLIVDFELYGQKGFAKDPYKDMDNNYLPYLIIGNWNYGSENDVIRQDLIQISYSGFTHKLNNNLAAIKEFIGLINKRSSVNMTIEYYYEYDENYSRVITKTICNTTDLYYMIDMPKRIKRFKFNKPEWSCDSVSLPRIDFKKTIIHKDYRPAPEKIINMNLAKLCTK